MRVELKVEDADLASVMEQIGLQAQRNILVDPNVHELVTIELEATPWREAVDIVARQTRCQVVERCDVLLLTQPKVLTIQASGLGARELIQLICEQVDRNVIICPELPNEDPEVEIKGLHWLVALRKVVAASGDYLVIEGALVRVVPNQ